MDYENEDDENFMPVGQRKKGLSFAQWMEWIKVNANCAGEAAMSLLMSFVMPTILASLCILILGVLCIFFKTSFVDEKDPALNCDECAHRRHLAPAMEFEKQHPEKFKTTK